MDEKVTLKNIREANKLLPAVMLTSVADKNSIIECSKLGMASYILKPINAADGPTILADIFVKL